MGQLGDAALGDVVVENGQAAGRRIRIKFPRSTIGRSNPAPNRDSGLQPALYPRRIRHMLCSKLPIVSADQLAGFAMATPCRALRINCHNPAVPVDRAVAVTDAVKDGTQPTVRALQFLD